MPSYELSVIDLAWVLAARRVCLPGRAPDEALVQRIRYLDGTPRGSTRWLEARWALLLEASTRELG